MRRAESVRRSTLIGGPSRSGSPEAAQLEANVLEGAERPNALTSTPEQSEQRNVTRAAILLEHGRATVPAAGDALDQVLAEHHLVRAGDEHVDAGGKDLTPSPAGRSSHLVDDVTYQRETT